MRPRRSAEQARSYTMCGAPGCGERVARGMLMCRPHWFALPAQLRNAISTSWQQRKTNGLATWSANVLAARNYLATTTPAAIAARITGDRS